MCGDLLRRVRSILELQPYDVLVSGEAVGELRLYDTLEEGILQCMRLNPSNVSREREQGRESFLSDHSSALNGSPPQERNGRGEDGAGKNRRVVGQSGSDNADAPAIILAARCATGDEEIAGLDGPHGKVVGVIIGHDLPILSHLGKHRAEEGERGM